MVWFGIGRSGPGRHRGLRWWVLRILERGPKNGAEIMDDMEAMSQGWWRPSPGSVYPLLDELTKEGTIKKLDDGRYELTDKAGETDWFRWGFGSGPRNVSQVLAEISNLVSYLEDLKRSKSQEVSMHASEIDSLSKRLEGVGK